MYEENYSLNLEAAHKKNNIQLDCLESQVFICSYGLRSQV
jgi:hypothetical protein